MDCDSSAAAFDHGRVLRRAVPVWLAVVLVSVLTSAGCTSTVVPEPTPSVTPFPAGHGSIWDTTDVVEVDEDGNFVFPEPWRWYREEALVLIVPESNSAEFWMGLHGHPEPTEELQINAPWLLFPPHLLELGEMFDVDSDGTFALPVPAGDYLLCVGTLREGGYEP